MKTAYVYSFIRPVPEDFKDDGTSEPLVAVPVELKDGRTWQAAVLGTPSAVRAVRISIPGLEGEKIPEEDLKRSMRLRDYILDCVRMAYDPSAEYLGNGEHTLSAWNFRGPEEGPHLDLKISEPLNPDYRVNAEGLKHLIAAQPKIRPIVHLIATGSDPRIPAQFRFLSFYKIIELHYRVTANARFNKFIETHVSEFQALNPAIRSARDVCRLLTTLRNKCAHIKLTKGEFGFSHIEGKADELVRMMSLLRRIAIRCVNVNHPQSSLRFASTPEEAAAHFAEMEAAGLKPVRVI